MDSSSKNTSIDTDSFKALANLAYQESGLQLVAEKTSMIQSRLRHRLRAIGMDSFANYAVFVCSDEGVNERRQMISALTTNVSHFFREPHHFDILVNEVIPKKIDLIRSGGRLRIWSAGCSNGQEAYSIAMALLNKFPELSDLDFKILATDIDPKVVAFAKHAHYAENQVTGISKDLLKRYFSAHQGENGSEYSARDSLKSHIVFNELNLLSDWPMKQEMDVIFCRNVVIYFDLNTQDKLWPRFRQMLAQDGHLFLGHSERIADTSGAGFLNSGPTAYRPNIPSNN